MNGLESLLATDGIKVLEAIGSAIATGSGSAALEPVSLGIAGKTITISISLSVAAK